MQRPNIVVIGGTEDQPLECVYCGAEGAQALDTFQAHANDGANELVRLFIYPDYSRVATPKRDEVPVADKPEQEPAPTVEEMEAATARIEELQAALEKCERSHFAAMARVGKLEKALEKITAKAPKPAVATDSTPATDAATAATQAQ